MSTSFGSCATAVNVPKMPFSDTVCVVPIGTCTFCGLAVIGGGVGVGETVGLGDTPGDPLGVALGIPLGASLGTPPADADGAAVGCVVSAGCAKGVAPGAGVSCACTGPTVSTQPRHTANISERVSTLRFVPLNFRVTLGLVEEVEKFA